MLWIFQFVKGLVINCLESWYGHCYHSLPIPLSSPINFWFCMRTRTDRQRGRSNLCTFHKVILVHLRIFFGPIYVYYLFDDDFTFSVTVKWAQSLCQQTVWIFYGRTPIGTGRVTTDISEAWLFKLRNEMPCPWASYHISCALDDEAQIETNRPLSQPHHLII